MENLLLVLVLKPMYMVYRNMATKIMAKSSVSNMLLYNKVIVMGINH